MKLDDNEKEYQHFFYDLEAICQLLKYEVD